MEILRYVVLRHEGAGEGHFDLMFETAPGSMLATWRSESWPPRSQSPPAALGDHRRVYLDYEGPISGNRGQVRRVASGEHTIVRDDGRQLVVRLDGVMEITLERRHLAQDHDTP